MFDGAQDQFHQFIAPRTSLPLHHLSFPLHASPTTNSFLPFDPYNPSSHDQLPLLQNNLLHPLHHQSPTPAHKDEDEEKDENSRVLINFEIKRDQRQLPELIDSSWSNDEVLALLRIRSSMESWFPELTWEHVSRKLAELGFRRSAEKCKEKFEEESRYFNNINNYGKSNCRFFNMELDEELYRDDQDPDRDIGTGIEKTQQLEKPTSQGQDKIRGHALEIENSRNIDTSAVTKHCDESDKIGQKSRDRKRKRRLDKFEMFKGFCERIVNKMMAQQEEIHTKLLQDMLKRDEEKFAREEAWKKEEMDRMNKELEMMSQEQAIASDRQASIIEFLKKLHAAASSPESQNFGGGNGKDKLEVTNGSIQRNSCTSFSSLLHSQNPNPSTGENNLIEPTPSSNMILNNQATGTLAVENPSSGLAPDMLQAPASSNSSNPALQNPSSLLNIQNNPLESNSVVSTDKVSSSPMSTNDQKEDLGRRWPRDEVLALINLRCTSLNNNSEDKEANKVPLWERISQGMSMLGYKRSAKRCKEKWENINKYFRKTKDANKKRPLDSRTCPYFHQLNNLYSQGKLVPQTEMPDPENHSNPTANFGQMMPPDQIQLTEPSQVGSGCFSMDVDHGGEKTLMQAPSLDFD